MPKILIVEDDVELSKKIRDWLTWEKHVVDVANNGDDGWEMIRTYRYDAIVLDWQMPGMTGVEICKQFRAKGGVTPILMLTGKETIDDKEQGLDAGADDYVTKPFHARELSARLRALLRRPADVYPDTLKVGGVTLESGVHRVMKDGREIQLQPKEFALLEFLMRHPGKVFSSKLLLESLWDADSEASEETIRTYMKTLRRKITNEGENCMIKTVHGLGYKIEE
jgi:DNA-binding response OmpR family regulator